MITLEGRAQLSQGGIDIAYITFTDSGTFYKADLASGSQDATQRIYFESCNLPQDDISFQADGDGNLAPFGSGDNNTLKSGKILTYSFKAATSQTIEGASEGVTSLEGGNFADAAEVILSAAADNFTKLRVLTTIDPLFEDNAFGIGPNKVDFTIKADRPIRDVAQYSTHVSALDSLFADPRFSNTPNFKYLPPVSKVSDRSLDRSDSRVMRPFFLGFFFPWGRWAPQAEFGLTYEQTMAELRYYQNLGYMKTFNIDPTSLGNRLVGQFFERSNDTLKKLDIVDFGSFQTGDTGAPVAHIYFVGKVQVDEKGTDTFLHLFTLVFQ